MIGNNKKKKPRRRFFEDDELRYTWLNFFSKAGAFSIAFSLLGLSIFSAVAFDMTASGEIIAFHTATQDGCDEGQFYFSLNSLTDKSTKYELCFRSSVTESKGIWLKASVFVGLLIFLVISFLFISIKEERDEIKIENKEQELKELIHTMPPPDAMALFKKLYAQVINFEELYVSAPDQESNLNENVKRLIRLCLDDIALLASRYSRVLEGGRVSTNVMVLKKTNEVDANIQALADRFANEKYVHGKSYQNVLLLKKELSSSTIDGKSTTIDNTLPDSFALPIPVFPLPKDSGEDFKREFLAGAPRALINSSTFDAIAKTTQLDEVTQRFNIDPAVWKRLKAYFASDEGKHIKSVLSIKLSGTLGDEVIGVLNIHGDQLDLFSKEALISPFVNLIEPFKLKIVDNMYLLRHLEEGG